MKQIRYSELPDDFDESESERFSDKYDSLKFLASVHGRIKKDFSSDFVLAKMVDKDIKYVYEMGFNAYFIKSVINSIIYNYKQVYKTMHILDEKAIKKAANDTFDIYVNKLSLISIMNRNKADNTILMLLGEPAGMAEVSEEKEDKNIFGKLKKLMKREPEKGDIA